MNLSKLREGNFKAFSRQDAAKAKANIDALKYVEFLGSQTSTSVELWDMKELIGDGQGYNFIKDKAEINKRFFSELEKRKAEPSKANDEVIREITRLTAMRGSEILPRLREDIRHQEQQIEAASNRIIQFRQSIFTLQNRIRAATLSSDPAMVAEFTKVIDTGFFKYEGIRESNIFFSTIPDIVMRHRNPAAGVDIALNMGKYVVAMNVSTTQCGVHPWVNNHFMNSYYHPYVGSDGRICFGDQALVSNNLLNQGNMSGYFSLLSCLLTTYAEGTVAYQALESFKRGIDDPEDNDGIYRFHSFPVWAYVNRTNRTAAYLEFIQSIGHGMDRPVSVDEELQHEDDEEVVNTPF